MTMMDKMGANRTGLARGHKDRDMLEGVDDLVTKTAMDGTGIADERIDYAKEAHGLGSMPPPASAKQVGKAAIEAVTGGSPNLFIDKLGERLAFERTGTRLYEGLLSKLSAYGEIEGGPTREELHRFHDQELAHFRLVQEAIESLGGDPTVMTPSADVVAVAGKGLGDVINDARTTLEQSLSAILIAELADNDGWDALVELARSEGHHELAERFAQATEEERLHLASVRAWVAAAEGRDAEAARARTPAAP